MPRDGSQIYHRPPGTDGIPDTTIESTKYNINVADVEQDLNLPRPIIAGGTGANNITDARFNLAAETATQIVTNYDSQVWTPGSFQSAAGATSAPNSTSVFAGVCYLGEALANPPTNQNVVIEARDINSPIKPGPVYTRQKTAGVWTAWGTTGGGGDAASNRAAIYAAPFDALAYNGMQFNGSMEVSQDTATTTINGGYALDGFALYKAGTAAVTLFRNATGSTFPGLPNALTLTVQTAQPTLGNSDYVITQHHIEGYRTARLGWGSVNAQPLTIGFWSYHSRAGTYSVLFRNASYDRSYGAVYTQNVASTPEYKTITIPGCTDSTWLKDNGAGIRVMFTIACGSGVMMAPNAWIGSGAVGVNGQVNCVASTGDVFIITGLVILPGIEAPSAARAPFIMRPYDQELLLCRRYYEKNTWAIYGAASAQSGTLVRAPFTYLASKRAVPTITASGGFGFNSFSQLAPVGTPSAFSIGYETCMLQAVGTGLTIGAAGLLVDQAASSLAIDARL